MSKTGHDNCWFCARPLRHGLLVVEVTLCRASEKGHKLTVVKQNPYDRACLSCAIKERIPGINAGNLDACYPSWRKQVTRRLQKLAEDIDLGL